MPMNLWMRYSRQVKRRIMDNLNASSFIPSSEIYEIEFQNILTGITTCYHMMLKDKVTVPNNENKIRDILYNNYLNNNKTRSSLKLTHFIFDCEVAEYDKGGNLAGYLDLKISTQNTFIESNAYYCIECKRLDNLNLKGTTGLNGEYINEGIMRFVTEHYSSYHGINGMIGLVVERMNIANNIRNINGLLSNNFKDANTQKKITPVGFIKNFKHSYYSIHKNTNEKEIKLYHLMFDFSRNIENLN